MCLTVDIRAVYFPIFMLLMSATAQGQPLQKSVPVNESKKVTFQDLKPKINYQESASLLNPIRQNAGAALLSSAIIPGSAQAANGKWIRAGAYLLADAVLLGVHFKKINDAHRQERQYKKFARNNWSVVNYANWLVEYHDANSQLNNQYINQLRSQISGKSASYSKNDWEKVDIELLRKVENNTPFVYPNNEVGNNFSHEMPDYGSQQYYELISKYYQFGTGWNDFGSLYQLKWDGSQMPSHFFRGARLAENFNDSYRTAGTMLSLLIINHFLSAFDAFLTVRLKHSRLETNTNLMDPQKTFSLKYHF